MYKCRRDLYVIGFPRSGSTWLSRLLGDLLDSPVTGLKSAHPLAEEGLNRPGLFVVRQLHLRPSYYASLPCLVPDHKTFAVRCWTPRDLLVTILRDPRDVCVSAWKYWDIDTLPGAIRCVGEGISPIGFGSWQEFVGEWLRTPIRPVEVRYETLLHNPLDTLKSILIQLRIELPTDERIWETIDRQAIDVRRKEIAINGDKYIYGRAIQLKHLRKGVAGDWKNWFTQREGELAEGYFGPLMRQLGYTPDTDWWKNLSEENKEIR